MLEENKQRILVIIFGALVFIITMAVFSGALDNNFVEFDDDIYILNNPVIKYLDNGEPWKIFSGMHQFNYWHPIAWLSHAIDYKFFELDPWGYHLTSVVIHALTSAIVFFLFISLLFVVRSETSWNWKVIIAALFASLVYGLHPLRVEPVVWVSQRKELLGGFFYFCGLLAYLQFVSAKSQRGRYLFYSGTLLIFCLGLMSKPHVVTFPAILLLLDWYPFKRFDKVGNWKKVLLEKVPFFALGLVFSAATMILQKGGVAIKTLGQVTIENRIWNAIRSLSFYIEKTLWPFPLVPIYPLEESPNWLSAPLILSAIVVIGISYLCLYLWRKGQPIFLAMWLYYIIAIFPAIGLIQVGTQAAADRFSYSTTLSFYILLGVGIFWFLGKNISKIFKLGVIGGGFIVLTFLAYSGNRQIEVWADGINLWTHVLRYYPDRAPIAHNNLGVVLVEEKKIEEAVVHYTEAIRNQPDYVEAHINLGIALSQIGNNEEATVHYKEAIRYRPDYAEAHNNLGITYYLTGNNEDAIFHYREAIKFKPTFAEAYYNLGLILGRQGNLENAIINFKKAISLKVNYAEAHNDLGFALSLSGNPEEAIFHFKIALEIRPDFAKAKRNLSNILAQQGKFQ
jgi:tetratricopeptide (TPR) repeat protein